MPFEFRSFGSWRPRSCSLEFSRPHSHRQRHVRRQSPRLEIVLVGVGRGVYIQKTSPHTAPPLGTCERGARPPTDHRQVSSDKDKGQSERKAPAMTHNHKSSHNTRHAHDRTRVSSQSLLPVDGNTVSETAPSASVNLHSHNLGKADSGEDAIRTVCMTYTLDLPRFDGQATDFHLNAWNNHSVHSCPSL